MNLFIPAIVVALVICCQTNLYAITVKDVQFVTPGAGKVVFRHTEHLQQKGAEKNCRACHDELFSLKKKRHFSMAQMKQGKSCGACHNGTKAFPLSACVTCHPVKEIVFKPKSTGPTPFSHRSHLATYPDCTACHPSLFNAGPGKRVSMAEMKKGRSCGACHNGRTAFGTDACASCHPLRDAVYQVPATGPVSFSHAPHIAQTGCSACHPGIYTPNGKNRPVGMAAMEKGKSCGACHNGTKSFPLTVCTRCHPVRDLMFEDKILGNILFTHTQHTRLYSCTGCHTSIYRAARSVEKVTMREMETGKSCGACHDGKTAFTVKDSCRLCHQI